MSAGKKTVRDAAVKVYGGFHPADADVFCRVEEAGRDAVGEEPWLFLEGDLLRISFEGAYFFLPDMLLALEVCLPPEAEGKLDYLDMEAWTLTRCQLGASAGEKAAAASGPLSAAENASLTRFSVFTRSLNHVLAYSGH